MNYLKKSVFSLSLLFLHTLYASSIDQMITASPAEIIKAKAIVVHNIAQSNSSVDSRIDRLKSIINELQTLPMSTNLTQRQQRYLLFLECFAWDILNSLKENTPDQLFYIEPDYMEPIFKRSPPTTQIRLQNFETVIDADIQNADFKKILFEMASASIKRDRRKYDVLENLLESLGQTLSGAEKEEFDLYRMILGPQMIIIPE